MATKRIKWKVLVFISLLIMGLTLTACSQPIEFKIDFIVDDTVITTINTNGNETIKMPADPIKDGFLFDGWYWDKDSWKKPFTANSLLDAPLTENLRVYAKWNDINALDGTQADFNGFTKNSTSTYSITVPNASTTLNFSDIVEVSNKSTWTLNKDISATQNIPSKIATLSEGDNTYYVLVTAENENVKLYTLNIRRKPLYLVTFNTSGGTAINSQNIEEDSFATMPSEPTKTGYTFIDWNYDFANAITAPATIAANWQANIYKVNYHANNGTEDTQEQNAVFNSSVILYGNTTFTKTAYDLVRWNTKVDGTGTNYAYGSTLNDYNIDDDLDLYAVWQATIYTITYHLDNDTNNDDNTAFTYNIESNTIVLNDPNKTGYSFDDWYIDSGFNNRIEEIENGSYGNVHLYAKFTIINYAINYNLDSGTNGENPATYNITTTTITLNNASKTGYDFIGWYKESTFINKITKIEKGNFGEIILYAKFATIGYSIDYKLDGGTNGDNPPNYTIESNTITLDNANKTGYDFIGWYTESGFTNKVTQINSGSHGNIDLYAKFELITYSIGYDLDNGTNGANPPNYTIETTTITLENASKTGYNFDGWFTEIGYQNKVTAIPKGSVENKTLYAKFTPTVYAINYHLDNGINGTNPASYTIESGAIALKNASKDYYDFKGWYTENSFLNKVDSIPSQSYGEVDLYAKFTPTVYNISYTLYGGTNGNNPTTYTFESNTISLSNANKTGYDFIGWYTESTFVNKIVTIPNASHGNIILFAKFAPTVYTITYHLDSGVNGSNPAIYTIESEDIILKNANKTGYDFKGWFTDSGFNNKIEQINSGSYGHKTLYAKFTPTVYSITYYLDGGTNGNNPLTYTIETNTIMLQDPYKTGYDFKGWFTDSSFEKSIETIEKGNIGYINLFAEFIPITYTISYYLDGGINGNNLLTYNIQTINFNLENPQKAGYDFIGWFSEDIFENEIKTIPMGTYGHIDLFAQFVANSYAITFNPNGGELGNCYLVIEYDSFITLAIPERNNYYRFEGWYIGNTQITDGIWQIAEDATLTAKWLGQLIVNSSGSVIGLTPYGIISTSIIIPETVDFNNSLNNLTITQINNNSGFINAINLKELSIPNSVTSLYGLKGCTNLERLIIPFIGTSRTATGASAPFGAIFGYTTFDTGYFPSQGNWPQNTVEQYSTVRYYREGSVVYVSRATTTHYCYYVPKNLREVIVTEQGNSVQNFVNCHMITTIMLADTEFDGYNAKIYCYSETYREGNFWYYKNDIPTKWN